ncbi:MAG: trypsin-like serine protease [bacterium]
MMIRTSLRLALSLVLLCASPAAAVVLRHDKPDSASVELGVRFDAAGEIVGIGGCTLIAPTWGVTAAHVAAAVPKSGGQVRFGDELIAIRRVVIHPEGSGPKDRPPEVDLALVELAGPVKGTRPLAIYRGREELGKTVYLVGYGDYGNPKSGVTRTDGRRRAATNVIDDAGPLRIFMPFDEPPLGTAMEGVSGPGDSGGPALMEIGEKLFVVGVSSGAMGGRPEQYAITDVYTRISAHVAWIDGILAGNDGRPERVLR